MERNKEVIIKFTHRQPAKGSNLISTGNLLINYNTVIGQFINNVLYINVTKYSPTTSKNQNILRFEADKCIENIKTIDNVPIGSMSLINFIPKSYDF